MTTQTDAMITTFRNLKLFGMADAIADLAEQASPAFGQSTEILNTLLKAGDGAEDGGFFSIELEGLKSSTQAYERNTAILKTVLESEDGPLLEITDFAPRSTSCSDAATIVPPVSIMSSISTQTLPSTSPTTSFATTAFFCEVSRRLCTMASEAPS